MGDQVQQVAEVVVTDEAKASRKAEGDRLAKEATEDSDNLEVQGRADAAARAAAQAEAAKRSEWRALLEKQLSLPARLERSAR